MGRTDDDDDDDTDARQTAAARCGIWIGQRWIIVMRLPCSMLCCLLFQKENNKCNMSLKIDADDDD